MRKIVLGLAATSFMLSAIPSFAQVGVDVGPGGVGVEVGRDRDYRRDRDRDYRREGYEERRVYREGEGRRFREGCRTVIVRDRRPDGDVVIRRIRRCD